MFTESLRRVIIQASIIGFVFFVWTLPLFADTNPLFENANDVRSVGIGLRFLVPKLWLTTDVVTKTALRGPEVKSFSLYPRSDKGSRVGASLTAYFSTYEGVFEIPERLHKTLTDSDFINWHISRLARTENSFRIINVRKGDYLGLPAFVVNYSHITADHFLEYVTERFMFQGENVYLLSSAYLSDRASSKSDLEAMAAEFRFLTDTERRYAPR